MQDIIQNLTEARKAISCELRRNNDNLGFDSAEEARHAILTHPDWADRWPDHTPELAQLAARYIAAVKAKRAARY